LVCKGQGAFRSVGFGLLGASFPPSPPTPPPPSCPVFTHTPTRAVVAVVVRQLAPHHQLLQEAVHRGLGGGEGGWGLRGEAGKGFWVGSGLGWWGAG
jgi:hypothetical protein